MDKIRKVDRKEAKIQEEIENRLKLLNWMVESTHGNIYQYGFPDLFTAHLKYGIRWIEVKNPDGWRLTPAQVEKFPMFAAHGVGIWIVTDALQVPEILFKPPNFWQFFGAFQQGSRRA